MKLKLNRPLSVFDLETTGLNVATARIVEISIIKVEIDGSQKTLTERINPTVPIPKETSAIHGIYDEDVKDKPTFADLAGKLSKFLDNCDLAGFNCTNYDIPLLVEEFLRAGVEFKSEGRKIVDVQKLYHMMEPRDLSAAFMFYCNKDMVNAHSAEADTSATLDILYAQLDKYSDKLQPNVEYLHKFAMQNERVDFAGRMIFDSHGREIFNFGKHKGKLVEEVLKSEPQYYDWIMKSEFPLDTKRKLTAIRLKSAN